MSRYLIEIEVNEDKLRRYNGIDVGEENEYEQSIESLIIQEMGWVEESGIYVTSVKEVESDVTGEYKVPGSVWEFVEEYYHGYVNSGQIAIADELQKIVDKEDEEGSMARDYFVHDCKGDMNEVIRQYEYVHHEIYKKSIEGYIESLKEKSENG